MVAKTDIQKLVQTTLSKFDGVDLAILYGSAAKDALRPDSDIDLAICLNKPLDVATKMEIMTELSLETGRSVDLVDLSQINGTLLKEVICKGVVLCKRNFELYEQIVLRMIYNQADVMPYVARTLKERQQRFING